MNNQGRADAKPHPLQNHRSFLDIDIVSRCMRRYWSTQCSTNLAACPRDAKTCSNRHNRVYPSQRQTKRKKGNPCESSMWHQTTQKWDSKNKTHCRRKYYRLSRGIHHTHIRLEHNETEFQQHQLRHQIEIHVHGFKIFLPEESDEYSRIQNDIYISMIAQEVVDKYNHKGKVHNV